MRRAVLQTRRYTPAQLREFIDSQESLSTSQASRQQGTYQGWAPGSSDADTSALEDVERYLESVSARHRAFEEEIDVEEPLRVRQGRHGDRTFDELWRARPSRRGDRVSHMGQSHFIENGVGAEPTITESSLRTTALLQSVRRNARISARSRDHLENYIIERARRTSQQSAEVEPPNTSNTTTMPPQGPEESSTNPGSHQHEQSVQQRDLRARMRALHTLQRIHHADCNSPYLSVYLEEAIKYLERLRSCNSYDDRISSATQGGFVSGEFFNQNHDDFILDTTTITAPLETSWLKEGGVFTGSQHAANINAPPLLPRSYLDRFDPAAAAEGRRYIPPRPRASDYYPLPPNSPLRGRIQPSTSSSSRPPEPDTAPNGDEDRWPVKVTIHSIDYNTMTLSGTMEAFNVPDKSSPTNRSSITTFLEGEIIDFNKFTLETKSFTANPRVDGTYWRKLEPFRGLSDIEMVKKLVSVRWLSEELGRKWILMRWKG